MRAVAMFGLLAAIVLGCSAGWSQDVRPETADIESELAQTLLGDCEKDVDSAAQV